MSDDKKIYDYEKAREPLSNALESARQMSATMTAVCSRMRQIFDVVYSQQTKEMITGIRNTMQAFVDVAAEFKVPEIKIPDELIYAFHKLSIIMALRKAEWPLFFYIDENFIDLFDRFVPNGESDSEIIGQMLMDYIDDSKISFIRASWKESLSIERNAIVDEAIKLYKNESYYGCVALFSCQIEGIISETYAEQETFGRKYTLEDLKIGYKCCNQGKNMPETMKLKKNPTEKQQLLVMLTDVESGAFSFMAGAEYLYNYIFTSNDLMNDSMHPCRHKICHGTQLNFGTKEHAIKAILAFDIAVKLSEELKQAQSA